MKLERCDMCRFCDFVGTGLYICRQHATVAKPASNGSFVELRNYPVITDDYYAGKGCGDWKPERSEQ